jgi:hypothetical protein
VPLLRTKLPRDPSEPGISIRTYSRGDGVFISWRLREEGNATFRIIVLHLAFFVVLSIGLHSRGESDNDSRKYIKKRTEWPLENG